MPSRDRQVQESAGGAFPVDATEVDEQQQADTADECRRQAETRDPPRVLRRRELTQHRVVRDAGQIAARRTYREQGQTRP